MSEIKSKKKRGGSFSKKRSGASAGARNSNRTSEGANKTRGNRQNNKGANASNRNRQHNRGTKKKAVSEIDPNQLIKKAVIREEKVFVPTKKFSELALHPLLKDSIAVKGYENPTQIQEESLDPLIAGKDVMGIANTGTGKTGAFLIPIINRLLTEKRTFTSLVVLPTRELALQVEEEFQSLVRGLGLFSASFIGGTSVNRDLQQLRRQNHIIIGTPGRLMDLADRGALKLRKIEVLVLDEFDRMLDMGFVHNIKKLVRMMENRRQTMLFSATVDAKQKTIISEMLNNPVNVKVSSGVATSDQVEQDIIRVPEGGDKFEMLLDLIRDDSFEKVLVFAETKRMVDKVTKKLNKSGIKSDMIHGNKSQNYRNNALNKFKSAKIQILVATDVAARGIDVTGVTHVINYQIPLTFDAYVHRIGRTGRAGKTGMAFTFID